MGRDGAEDLFSCQGNPGCADSLFGWVTHDQEDRRVS